MRKTHGVMVHTMTRTELSRYFSHEVVHDCFPKMRKYIFHIIGICFLFTSLSFSQIAKQKYLDDDFEKKEWFLKNQGKQSSSIKDSNFTLLGRWAWGACRAMAITGKYALVGQGWMYQVYDLTDPYKPTVVYDTIMEGPVVDIKIKDTLLFILLGGTAIIYDSRSPFPLKEYGRYYTDGLITLRDMSVSDSLLYLIGRNAGIIAVNIENLSQPYFRWYFPYGMDNPSAIASMGNYIFYGALGPWSPVLYVVKKMQDSTFYQHKGIWIDGNAVTIHLRDSLLFVSNNNGRLFIFNISDPWEPQTIDSLDINSCVYSMGSKGDNLYCSTIDSGIVIVNISDISNPKIMTHYNQGYAKKLSCSNDILGIAGWISFSFFNIQPTDSIDKYIELPVCVNTLDIALKGNLGFIASGDNGVWSVDFSDPAHPDPIKNLPIYGYSSEIKITRDILCVLSKKVAYGVPDSLILIQFDEHGDLIRLSSIEIEDNTTSLAIFDSIVVIGADSIVGIYSISDPFKPYLVYRLMIPGRETRISISHNLLAVTNRVFNSGFRIFDIIQPSSPVELFYLPTDALGVLMDDSLTYIGGPYLQIYNTEIPTNPSILANTNISCGSAVKFAREGRFLYKTGDYFGTVDISDLTQPIEISSIFWYWAAMGFSVRKDTIYLATASDGVWIIKNNFVDSNDENVIDISTSFSLKNNYPNPFNPSTIIEYQIPTQSHVTIKVFDILGRELLTLVDETKQAGTYKMNWNASNLPAGVYFSRMTTDKYSRTNKMLLIR